MMEVPAIVKTWVDSDGVTVYTVQYKDGSTCDMTVQQYDYLKRLRRLSPIWILKPPLILSR